MGPPLDVAQALAAHPGAVTTDSHVNAAIRYAIANRLTTVKR